MNFTKFLIAEESVFRGRTLNQIWSYTDTDDETEHIHDFIQILFPLNEKSRSSFHGYYLNHDLLIEQIKGNKVAQRNIVKSAEWFRSFLKRRSEWEKPYQHNHLRITRIIKCLRLLVSEQEADKFFNNVMSLLGEQNHINAVTLEYWRNA